MNKRRYQCGAILVETALTMSLFMLLLMATFEIALLVSEWARSVEATRRVARTLVVNDSPMDISSMDCTAGGAVTFTCASADCGVAWERASAIAPSLNAGNVHVTYACSTASYPDRPVDMPVLTITVEVRDHTSQLVIPGLVGLPVDVVMPAFTTTRISEDMHTPAGG